MVLHIAQAGGRAAWRIAQQAPSSVVQIDCFLVGAGRSHHEGKDAAATGLTWQSNQLTPAQRTGYHALCNTLLYILSSFFMHSDK